MILERRHRTATTRLRKRDATRYSTTMNVHGQGSRSSIESRAIHSDANRDRGNFACVKETRGDSIGLTFDRSIKVK